MFAIQLFFIFCSSVCIIIVKTKLTACAVGYGGNTIRGIGDIHVVAMGIGLERINDIAQKLQDEVRATYDEPDATVQAFDVDALGGNALTTECTAKVIALLCTAPNGVQKMSADIDGLVQTSLNLGIAKLGNGAQVVILEDVIHMETEAVYKDWYHIRFTYQGEEMEGYVSTEYILLVGTVEIPTDPEEPEEPRYPVDELYVTEILAGTTLSAFQADFDHNVRIFRADGTELAETDM